MGEVVQIRDFQNKKDIERMQRAQALEQQALEIMNIALMGEPGMVGMEPVIHIPLIGGPHMFFNGEAHEPIPFGGQGIDGMFTDTAPSEMNPDQPA